MIIQLSKVESVYLVDYLQGAVAFTEAHSDNPDMALSCEDHRAMLQQASWGKRLEIDARQGCLLAQGLGHVVHLSKTPEDAAEALLAAVAEQVLEKVNAALAAEGIAYEYEPDPAEEA